MTFLKENETPNMLDMQIQIKFSDDKDKTSLEPVLRKSQSIWGGGPAAAADSNVINRLIRASLISVVDLSRLIVARS